MSQGPLSDSTKKQSQSRLPKAAIAIGVVACLLAIIAMFRPDGRDVVGSKSRSRLEEMKEAGVLRVGYGGWPPYTVIDAASADDQEVTGFAVDLVEEIASRSEPPFRIEWHRFSWDSLRSDMSRDKFDFIAEPVFLTAPRIRDLAFCRPYAYFGIGAAVVKVDDDRFSSFDDLDRPDITIALAEGWTTSEFAKRALSKPNFKSIPVSGEGFSQLDEVLFDRADVALNDVPTVAQYVEAHSDKVKALWLDAPPSQVAGSFVVRQGDEQLRNFLNSNLEMLIADGTLRGLDAKWKSFGFVPQLSVRPGHGIADRRD